jgi:hypothetical protein
MHRKREADSYWQGSVVSVRAVFEDAIAAGRMWRPASAPPRRPVESDWVIVAPDRTTVAP